MENIGVVLLHWYGENKRMLPWRETTDPYQIWISEVILQQTRVAQGLAYFNRFMERFPRVEVLAEASEDEVMKYWQGLGYYSRARNLHTAAKQIMERFNGRFPENHRDVLSLKGIGEYTAAAICSFAWCQPYAVVDGNVYRVIARLLGVDIPIDTSLGKKTFSVLAQELLVDKHPDEYNQAIMDFGAMQCTPKSPSCTSCPLQQRCVAFEKGTVDQLPVKQGKIIQKQRYFNYLHIRYQGLNLIARRNAKDIWQNLYEFPLIETPSFVDFVDLQELSDYQQLFENIKEIQVVRMLEMPKHILSHRIIHTRIYQLELSHISLSMQNYLQVSDQDLDNYPISRLLELYLEQFNRE